jgi:TRAP-type C4-dicarboxylate transport system permease small subunit
MDGYLGAGSIRRFHKVKPPPVTDTETAGGPRDRVSRVSGFPKPPLYNEDKQMVEKVFPLKVFLLIDKGLVSVLKTLIVIFAAVMLILMLIQVIFRYFLFIPSPWSEDLARLALVWTTFLASALGVRNLEHPKIDILTKHFPAAVQFILEILIYLAITGFGFILLLFGSRFAWATRIDHYTSLQYPKNFFYWPGPVAGVLFIGYSCAHIVLMVRVFTGKKEEN